jgi:hypothetical protein
MFVTARGGDTASTLIVESEFGSDPSAARPFVFQTKATPGGRTAAKSRAEALVSAASSRYSARKSSNTAATDVATSTEEDLVEGRGDGT